MDFAEPTAERQQFVEINTIDFISAQVLPI
jgi:hypothetical protein